jgi:5-methylcytosine-specific restriction endonuclease McrA
MPKEDWPDWNIYVRDKCTCQYCGMSGIGDFDKFRHLSIDHIKPRAAGGDDSEANKVVACKRCNELLGRMVPKGERRDELLDSKRKHVAALNRKEYGDYQQMMIELLPGVIDKADPE